MTSFVLLTFLQAFLSIAVQSSRFLSSASTAVMYKELTTSMCISDWIDRRDGWRNILTKEDCIEGAAIFGWTVSWLGSASWTTGYPAGCLDNNQGTLILNKHVNGNGNPCTPNLKCLCVLTCPAGSYQDESGETSCKTCSAGFYSVKAATSCAAKCPVGTRKGGTDPYGNAIETACTPCDGSKYSDEEGLNTCKLCPDGKYQDQIGQSNCTTCATGKYLPSTSNRHDESFCLNTCYAGSYILTDHSDCVVCQEGQWQDESNQHSCKQCLANGVGQPSPCAVDCVGTWSDCGTNCLKVFNVAQPALDGGKPCPASPSSCVYGSCPGPANYLNTAFDPTPVARLTPPPTFHLGQPPGLWNDKCFNERANVWASNNYLSDNLYTTTFDPSWFAAYGQQRMSVTLSWTLVLSRSTLFVFHRWRLVQTIPIFDKRVDTNAETRNVVHNDRFAVVVFTKQSASGAIFKMFENINDKWVEIIDPNAGVQNQDWGSVWAGSEDSRISISPLSHHLLVVSLKGETEGFTTGGHSRVVTFDFQSGHGWSGPGSGARATTFDHPRYNDPSLNYNGKNAICRQGKITETWAVIGCAGLRTIHIRKFNVQTMSWPSATHQTIDNVQLGGYAMEIVDSGWMAVGIDSSSGGGGGGIGMMLYRLGEDGQWQFAQSFSEQVFQSFTNPTFSTTSFGVSVALSDNVLVVGSNAGAFVYMRQSNSSWVLDYVGKAEGRDQDLGACGSAYPCSAASTKLGSLNSWTLGQENGGFGRMVQISPDSNFISVSSYHLEVFVYGMKNLCRCANGTPNTGSACKTNGAESCAACDSGVPLKFEGASCPSILETRTTNLALLNHVNTSLVEKSIQLQRQNEDNALVSNELREMNASRVDCVTQLNTVVEEKTTLIATVNVLTGDKETLENMLQGNQSASTIKWNALNTTAHNLTLQLAQQVQQRTECLVERDQCVAEKTAVSVGFTNLTLQLAAERVNCSLAKNRLVNEHATIVEGKNNTVVELQHQLKELARQVTEKEDEKTNLKNEKATLENEKAMLENEKAMLDEHFQTTVQEKNTTIVDLQKQLKELERQLAVEKENEEEKEETRTTMASTSTSTTTTESPALLQPKAPATPSSSATSCGFIECDAFLIQRTGFDSTTMMVFGFGFFIYAMVISLAVVILACLRWKENTSFEKDLESFGVTKVKPTVAKKKQSNQKKSNQRMLERLSGVEKVRQEENRASRRRSRQGGAVFGSGDGGSQHI